MSPQSMDTWLPALYALPLLAIVAAYMRRQRRIHERHRRVHEDSVAPGITEPASLHPLIDPSLCLGSGARVKACPETQQHHVNALLSGKSALNRPTSVLAALSR